MTRRRAPNHNPNPTTHRHGGSVEPPAEWVGLVHDGMHLAAKAVGATEREADLFAADAVRRVMRLTSDVNDDFS